MEVKYSDQLNVLIDKEGICIEACNCNMSEGYNVALTREMVEQFIKELQGVLE